MIRLSIKINVFPVQRPGDIILPSYPAVFFVFFSFCIDLNYQFFSFCESQALSLLRQDYSFIYPDKIVI